MISKLISFPVLFLLGISTTVPPPNPPNQQSQSQQQQPYHPPINRDHDSIKFIGPHNWRSHYRHVRSIKTLLGNNSILDAIKTNYNITPILRDLESAHLDEDDFFETVMKREIAWNYADLNEFGLLRCEEMKFRRAMFPGYIELIPNGRRAAISVFSNSTEYKKLSQEAKDIQTKCLIRGLEKTGSSSTTVDEVTCKTKIPFCFADSWRQIWWKVEE